jgi:hypothetical protein
MNTRTPQQVVQQQARDAAMLRQRGAFRDAPPPPSTAVAVAKPQLQAVPDNRSDADRFLDDQAGGGLVGRAVKFTKDGAFEISDTSEHIDQETDFVVLADQTLTGWIKFNGKGAPPDRIMGLFYGEPRFIPPPRESLGDTDEAAWEQGINGLPADPWQLQFNVVLQHAQSLELFTFVTSSKTGRRAVGNLLKHYQRMPQEFYPVVRLKAGGFQHRDERVGWVHAPAFAVVGKAPKDGSPTTPDTSPSADFDDQISF